ncbi:MAG TPA: hypothetical protein VE078_08895 [Thermoanaerobaculia bacterium]|nr:hypothetical protein [Thermoanaerobaculia bacterium]
MATPLKRIDLFLDEELIDRLNQEAAQRHVSPSEVVQTLLSRDLGLIGDIQGATERIRRLREKLGPFPDSAGIIRESRDQGW